MTVSTYLKSIAENAVLSSAEKNSIARSELVLKQKISAYFGTEIKEQFRFGSYDRGTILPRSMDSQSDVDYMVVFDNSEFRPQTYLDRLRRFASENYTKSEISQNHPVIQLELSNIRFELVPAIKTFIYGLRIPQKDGTEQHWRSTDPKDAHANIIEKNKENNFLIKPLVRLVKYWNAHNDYVFESFELEKQIVAHEFKYLGLYPPTDLKECFFEFMKSRPELWQPQRQMERVQRAKKIIDETRRLEKSGQSIAAENEIKKLIPALSGNSQNASYK